MLYEFYGEECPHCMKMRVLSNKLLEEHPEVKLERKEVWHNKENMALVMEYDKGDACGGVPFYYNSDNGEWLCGEVTYDELKKWAGVA